MVHLPSLSCLFPHPHLNFIIIIIIIIIIMIIIVAFRTYFCYWRISFDFGCFSLLTLLLSLFWFLFNFLGFLISTLLAVSFKNCCPCKLTWRVHCDPVCVIGWIGLVQISGLYWTFYSLFFRSSCGANSTCSAFYLCSLAFFSSQISSQWSGIHFFFLQFLESVAEMTVDAFNGSYLSFSLPS